MADGLPSINGLPPKLPQFEMPSKPQLNNSNFSKYVKQGFTVDFKDFALYLKYVGAERSHDTLHSGSILLSSIRVNEWLNRQLEDLMHQMLPDSFFSLSPHWNLRVYAGVYTDYSRKRPELQTFAEQTSPNFAVNFGMISGLSLDFSFEYFNASLVLQNHFALVRSLRAVDTLGMENVSTDLTLYYHFLDDKLHFGIRMYLDKLATWQEAVLDNLFVTLAWDI